MTVPIEDLSIGLTKKREVWQRLYPQCVAVAEDMIKFLDPVRVKGNHGAIESLYKTIKAAWQKNDLEQLQKRLGRIYQHLHHHIIEQQQEKILRNLFNMAVENSRHDASRQCQVKELEALPS